MQKKYSSTITLGTKWTKNKVVLFYNGEIVQVWERTSDYEDLFNAVCAGFVDYKGKMYHQKVEKFINHEIHCYITDSSEFTKEEYKKYYQRIKK